MIYESNVTTMTNLLANFTTKSLGWRVDCIAILRQMEVLVRSEHLPAIKNVLKLMEEHDQQCELRSQLLEAINTRLADIVLYAVQQSCATQPALINRFEPGFVWALDEAACEVCGVKIHNGNLDDTGLYCDVEFVLDEWGFDPAPHGLETFYIRMDRSSREYLEYRYEAKNFKEMLYEAAMFDWFDQAMSIQQLEDIAAWVDALRVAAFLRMST